MKTNPIIVAALLLSLSSQSQNKNVLSTTKTTITTVKDGIGKDKVFVKKENVQENQNIELKEAQSDTKNVEIKESPVSITKTTEITNPDGSTRTTSIDRTGYYLLDNSRYKIDLDAQGYTFTSEGIKKPYLLRKTSTNSYIYVNESKVAVSYFDKEGNLIIETYNDKTDSIETKKYTLVKN